MPDITHNKPFYESSTGRLHPLTQIMRRMEEIFVTMGFVAVAGPEVEKEFYNFDALNIPADHPSRDMQDTFWLKPLEAREVLRTQTSAVQVRYMEAFEPPLRVIVPGKVFRNEATDATHEAQFYQIEGLMVDKHVSVANLKGTLEHFFKTLLGKDAKIRFRPSYFGFVEPGLEVDVWFRGRWLELMGAGLVHPNVLRSAKLDPNVWQGFAFGGGVDRMAMVLFDIPDVRYLYSGDMRLVSQL